jgi:hypothetical protein
MKLVIAIMFNIVFVTHLKAQISPCTDGQQASCKCQTADIICTPDELDGVILPMSSFRHPQDAPTPLCSGDGAPDNPSWVGFTAWCESFSVRLILDDCSGMCNDRTPCRPGFFPCGFFGGACSFGVQVAVYESCDFSRSVACDVNECRESDIIFNLNNLVPGTTYYFMVDGCSGSACNVTFEVLEFCGKQELPPWRGSIEGPLFVCQEDSVKFSVDTFEFADNYHWFVDGSLKQTSSANDFSYIFDSLGVYEICVDISSGDCVFIEDDPKPICQKINVFQSKIDSLTIQKDDICPDVPVFIQSHITDNGVTLHNQILITDINNRILSQIDSDALTWTPEECGVYKVWAILSSDKKIWDTESLTSMNSDRCTDLLIKTFTITDSEEPLFLETPDDLVLECYKQIPDLDSLMVRDNCNGDFFVEGQEILPQNLCSPGSWVRTWTAMDKCGNMTVFEQTISIRDSFTLPQWNQLPADTIIECRDIPDVYENLEFSNGASDTLCQINGIATPVVIENINDCKGTITVLWEYEDPCGRKLTHFQNIQVICSLDSLPDWTGEIKGPNLICEHDSSLFFIEKMDWAEKYHWYIGNEEIAEGPDNFISVSWDSTGNFLLCVDVSSSNCFEKEDIPDANCKEIRVFEVQIDSLVMNTSGSCPKEPVFIQSFYGSPVSDMYSNIFILDSENNIIIQSQFDTLTWWPDTCGVYKVISTLSTHQRELSVQNILAFPESRCDDFLEEVLVVADDVFPVFQDIPVDLTLECFLQLPVMDTLIVSDNCIGEFVVSGTETLPEEWCLPNSWERTWVATDLCGNTASITQNVSVSDTFPPPTWLQLPKDTTIECSDVPAFFDNLRYDNFASEPLCQITGETVPVIIDNTDQCKGNITVLWEYVDLCGRKATHSQRIYLKDEVAVEFYIPDIFNPQSSSGNSTFFIGSNKELKIDEFIIWDRWGSKVFENRNILTGSFEDGWNGSFHGRKVNSGVYVYSAVITMPDQSKTHLQGTVSVIF